MLRTSTLSIICSTKSKCRLFLRNSEEEEEETQRRDEGNIEDEQTPESEVNDDCLS